MPTANIYLTKRTAYGDGASSLHDDVFKKLNDKFYSAVRSEVTYPQRDPKGRTALIGYYNYEIMENNVTKTKENFIKSVAESAAARLGMVSSLYVDFNGVVNRGDKDDRPTNED